MEFDFTTIMDRVGKDATAVEVIPVPGAEIKEGFTRLPMWVADMNFGTAPSIPEAVIRRAQHTAFGYFNASDDYYNSIISW
jgi:cystathionine beta-lyase